MATRITITDNSVERIEIDRDNDRLALIKTTKGLFPNVQNYTVIILNAEERKRLKELL